MMVPFARAAAAWHCIKRSKKSNKSKRTKKSDFVYTIIRAGERKNSYQCLSLGKSIVAPLEAN